VTNPDVSFATLTRPEKAHDLCCIGTALIDYVSTADLEVVASLGIEPGAMTLIDGATATTIRSALGEGRLVPGGTVANTAAGVASLGGSPIFVGAIANDDLGERYASDLQATGIRAVLERIPASGPDAVGTGACYVIVTPDSQRTMATNLGVSGQLHATTIDVSTVGSAEFVYFDGYLLDFPDSAAIVDRIIEVASRSATKVALGLADPFVVDRHFDRLRVLVKLVDVLFSNEAEAKALTGAVTVDEAVRSLHHPGGVSIVTCGPAGARIISDEGALSIQAVPVAEVVDVTGAGDLFAAGVCFGLSHGLTVEGAGNLGALCASEAIGHFGARPVTSLETLASDAGLI
jgi:sugar/nucleoside kinase (ribokinase family)